MPGKNKKKKKRVGKGDGLNLLPVMNLVTILIPFLLMAMSMVSLAVIDSTLPAIGAPPTEPPDPDDRPLNLSVIITDQGYTVAGSSNKLAPPEGEKSGGPTLPCTTDGCPTPDTYDRVKLTELLGEIKDDYPDEENVILVPESTVPYEVLVLTMDATRADPDNLENNKPRELFPYVVIAGGAQ